MSDPKFLRSMSISVKLFLLFLLIFLPAAGIIIASSFEHRSDAIREAENRALLLVWGLGAEQNQITAGTKQMLSTLAQLPAVKGLDASACNELFSELIRQRPLYSFIGLATPDGNVFASAAAFGRDANPSYRKNFVDAIRTLHFSADGYLAGRVGKVPSISFTCPVLNANKKLVATLIAGLRVDEYAQFLTKVKLPPGSVCVITDYRGTALFSFPKGEAAAPGTHVSKETFRHMSGDREQGTFETTARNGASWFYAFKRLRIGEGPHQYIYTAVGIPKSRIVERPDVDMLGNLSGLGLLGIIAMLFVWMSARRYVIQPINKLVETAQLLGKGELGARTCLPHALDEIGQLAKSFDEMGRLLGIRNDERTRVEAEIQRAYEDLDAKVALRTEELASANESLRAEVLERRKAEEAFRAALIRAEDEKSRSESIIAGMSDSLTITDRDFKIVYQNDVAKALLGNHEGEFCYRGIHGGDHICGGCPVVACFVDGGTYRKESGMVIDGKTYYVEISASPLRNSAGEITGAIEIGRDITERKRAEGALLESREQLLDIINFLPDATLVIDREGKVIAWNLAMEKMTGVDAAAMLGKGGYEHAVPFYGERRPMLIDLVLEPSEEFEAKYENLKRRSGILTAQVYRKQRYVLGAAGVLYDSRGNVVGAVESMRDITEQKLMEEAVARAEQKYRDIFENSVIGIFQVSREGHFLSLNMAMAQGLGYNSPEEVLSEVSDVTQLYVHPERRSDMRRLIKEQGFVREFEAEFFRKDKSVVWVSINVRAVRDSDGKIAYMEGTAQDITDSENLKSHLAHASKMEAIGTLAGGIAHDFNNVLTPIIGYTELTLNLIPKDSREHHNLVQVLNSARRAKDLVKQVLTFSRKTELDPKPVQVSLIIKEALRLLRSSLPSTIEIHKDLHEDADAGAVTADPTQIHQVLMNLCANAAHAMREKGGTLKVTLESVDLVPGAERGLSDMEPGPYLKLSVADTGHGMVEEVRQRIFEPYFTTKGPDEGTGLGLAVVYGIVKNLSGRIDVFSKPDEGSTFDVYLPKTKTIPSPPADVSASLPTGHGLILLVDDEKSIVDMMKEMLQGLGYKVVPKYSSTDALEAFRKRPESFHLVITDLTMPRMTGIDLAREILAVRPGTPIILCTGFSDDLDENRTKLLGIEGFLRKPVALRDLAGAVSKILAPA